VAPCGGTLAFLGSAVRAHGERLAGLPTRDKATTSGRLSEAPCLAQRTIAHRYCSANDMRL
jgi:hypothetical protein